MVKIDCPRKLNPAKISRYKVVLHCLHKRDNGSWISHESQMEVVHELTGVLYIVHCMHALLLTLSVHV